MKVLLDTTAFLWWVTDDNRLPRSARAIIQSPHNTLYFSAVSGWEIAIKAALGRVKVKRGLPQWIGAQLRKNRFTPLPITIQHAVGTQRLPQIHHDPFDRILVSQCRIEKCRLLTADPEIMKYPVRILW